MFMNAILPCGLVTSHVVTYGEAGYVLLPMFPVLVFIFSS